MKICLFGGSGLLGSEFKRVLAQREFNFIAPTRAELDVLNRAAVLNYLAVERPDLVICCAAYTDVDGAEADEAACHALNVGLVETLVESGIGLIHFSTDYVFNAPLQASLPGGGIEGGELKQNSSPNLLQREDQGEGSLGPTPSPGPSQREGSQLEVFEIPEDYPRDPQSVYAQSKAAAEEVLEASGINWWNIRTSWLHGPGGKNFVSTIVELSKTHHQLSIVDDQIGRPTYAPELAEFVVEHFVSPLLQPSSADKTPLPTGHYHLQNQGEPLSWAGWAEHFLAADGWTGTVKKITTAEFGAPAPRPQNSVLGNTKLKADLRDYKG